MSNKGLDRRNFIKLSSMALVGGYAGLKSGAALAQRMGGGGMGGGGMGGGGGGGGYIDPPPGANFSNPMDMTIARTTEVIDNMSREVATVNLEAVQTQVNVNGVLANLMTYNGYFPGPTIKVKKNDVVRINFTNSLPASTATNLLGYRKYLTNLHTHGWHVSPEPPSDYVMYELANGQTYHHEYDLAQQPAGAFNFYHPHKHGVSAEQYWAGLVGALITEDDLPVFNGTDTKIMVLKDIELSGADPAPHTMMSDYMHGKSGSIVMVNGMVNPVLPIKPGQVQRWRLLNSSNVRHYLLNLEGHSLYLVGTDGHLLDKPYPMSQILLAPGERVEVLVKASTKAGTYKFYSLPYAWQGNMSSEKVTLLTLNVNGSKASQVIPKSINPAAQRLNPNSLTISAQRTLALSMGMGNGYINGQDFDVNPYTIMSDVGTYEIWTITNDSGMDHPFHQHVNPSQILAINGRDTYYPDYSTMPAWKDVVLIPKFGSVTMLVPVMDYPGMAMFHCHILEHEDIGMMGLWHLMGPGGMTGM